MSVTGGAVVDKRGEAVEVIEGANVIKSELKKETKLLDDGPKKEGKLRVIPEERREKRGIVEGGIRSVPSGTGPGA